MMRMYFILSILPLALAACAAPARYDFVKDGASAYQRTDALSECKYQIRLNKISTAEQDELLRLCMQGKGYRWRQVS